MLNNCFCRTPLESSSVFEKSGENFNPEQLTNLMLADNSFTENFTADVPVGIFHNFENNIHSCFCWQIYQLLLKVISLQKKVPGVPDTLQSKKKKKGMNKKHSQLFLKIGLPIRKNNGENEN